MKTTKKTKPAKKATAAKPDLAVKQFRSQAAWETWLKKQHEASPGVWLLFAKKGSGLTTVSYKEALEVALCYGWIDGLVGSVDDKVYKQRFTPRRARSKWSQINVAAMERLHAAGRLAPEARRFFEGLNSQNRYAILYRLHDAKRPETRARRLEEFIRMLREEKTFH